MPNCHCKAPLKNRDYILKDGTLRRFYSCSKEILHTYSEEALKEIDIKLYQNKHEEELQAQL